MGDGNLLLCVLQVSCLPARDEDGFGCPFKCSLLTAGSKQMLNVLLDLTTTFDTVDYDLLAQCLVTTGFCGTVTMACLISPQMGKEGEGSIQEAHINKQCATRLEHTAY